MLSTNEIKVGTAFMYENAPFIVQRMLGQKSGRAGMVTRLRVKNIVTGGTQDLGLMLVKSSTKLTWKKRPSAFLMLTVTSLCSRIRRHGMKFA